MRFTKFLAFIVAAATLAVGCGGDNPENVDKPKGGATLKADVQSVEVNNPITFTVTAEDGTDITAEATIFDKTHNFAEVSNPFTPTEDGKYEFYAVAGNAITETIEVVVLPSIPALPADTNEASTEFKHRILLVDHTGNTCGYCPKMMLALKEVSETGDYHSKYYEAMSHSYASSDPATSASANAISSYFGITSYPTLTYNFAYSTSSSYNAEHIKSQIDAQWKESADAGIAASASLATSSVVVNAEVKAAVENEYRINAWLLEDGIVANQTNGTEEWMNTHDNAIRQAVKTNPISGMELGTIKAGEKASLAMSLEITSSKWVRDNLKVMVIASAKNANGKFEVVNVAICPVDGNITYDYK
ncbi:MAG: Omp28-related outer membrane protein [Alistipes sp.]|nr:Omp28-related outer membrane protein [Alistipes sp.]